MADPREEPYEKVSQVQDAAVPQQRVVPQSEVSHEPLVGIWDCRVCGFGVREGPALLWIRTHGEHYNARSEKQPNNGIAYCPTCDDETLRCPVASAPVLTAQPAEVEFIPHGLTCEANHDNGTDWGKCGEPARALVYHEGRDRYVCAAHKARWQPTPQPSELVDVPRSPLSDSEQLNGKERSAKEEISHRETAPIPVPDVPGPEGICWQQKADPPGVIHFHLGRCGLPKGHELHQWDRTAGGNASIPGAAHGQVVDSIGVTKPVEFPGAVLVNGEDMPVCVRLARERLTLFVNDEVPITARDLREMLSAVVVEYEALHSLAGSAPDSSKAERGLERAGALAQESSSQTDQLSHRETPPLDQAKELLWTRILEWGAVEFSARREKENIDQAIDDLLTAVQAPLLQRITELKEELLRVSETRESSASLTHAATTEVD